MRDRRARSLIKRHKFTRHTICRFRNGNYPNVAKLWNRLGFAPYDGLAGSAWKRPSWRPRALDADEWIEHPFDGERYAMIYSLGDSMFRHQIGGKAKSANGKPVAKGPYGKVYIARRAHTAKTHPDWSDGHSHKDALRVMMKAFLRDFWCAWNGKQILRGDQEIRDAQAMTVALEKPPPVRKQVRVTEELDPSIR